jgi:hypothetical protein
MENLTIQRSSFLNIICILTFIGCAFSIASGIYSYQTGEKKLIEIQQQKEMLESKEAPAFSIEMLDEAEGLIQKSIANKTLFLWLNIVCSIICAIGAFLMFRLKKIGFFIYAVPEIIAPSIVLLILGMGTGAMGMFMSFGTFVFPIIFISMYASQLNDME